MDNQKLGIFITELRKEKKTILINKTVDNYKKLSYMEADNG